MLSSSPFFVLSHAPLCCALIFGYHTTWGGTCRWYVSFLLISWVLFVCGTWKYTEGILLSPMHLQRVRSVVILISCIGYCPPSTPLLTFSLPLHYFNHCHVTLFPPFPWALTAFGVRSRLMITAASKTSRSQFSTLLVFFAPWLSTLTALITRVSLYFPTKYVWVAFFPDRFVMVEC